MDHHPIFDSFQRVTSDSTGAHMFDFLGVKTRVSFRRGWEAFAKAPGSKMAPGYPPLNEHYFDWIATLLAVKRARGTFRMVELGAGWAPWLTRGAAAAKQNSDITGVELLSVEADPTHFDWIKDHFTDNDLDPDQHDILFGAASAETGILRFPVVENPDEDYGASLRAAKGNIPYIEVPSYTVPDLLARMSGPVDFMHVDIQGAEYEALPTAIDELKSSVKSIMVGTHLSSEMHAGLASEFEQAGWREVYNFDRAALCQTDHGEVQFGDGFLLYENPALVP